MPRDASEPADAASVEWPTDPPSTELPQPTRTDGCDFGARSDDLVILASGDIVTVAVDDGYAYFGTSSNIGCAFEGCVFDKRLKRVPRCGGTVEEVSGVVDEAVLGGGAAYWIAGADLVRYDEAAGTTSVVSHEGACLDHLVANDAGIAVYDKCRSVLLHAGHGDAALTDGPKTASPATAMWAGTKLVYFHDAQGIAWWSPDTGARGRARATTDSPLALAPDDHGMLAMLHTPGALDASLVRWPAGGGAAVPVATGVRPSIATDDGSVYFTDSSLEQLATDGSGTPTTVLDRFVNELQVFGGRLYWVQAGDSASDAPKYLLTGTARKERPRRR